MFNHRACAYKIYYVNYTPLISVEKFVLSTTLWLKFLPPEVLRAAAEKSL